VRFLGILSTGTLALLLAGCASISVSETTYHRPPPRAPELPAKILVRGFQTPDANFRVDREGEDLRAFQQDTRERLTRQIVRRLRENVAPADAIATTAPAARGPYWLLEGQFDQVNQGSRGLRALIGFGLGGTKMNTTSVLYDMSGPQPKPLLRIRTTGGTNAEPGAVAALNPLALPLAPLGMGLQAAAGARGGVVFDTVRTAREIVAAISEYAHTYGLIDEEQALQPKREGFLPAGWARILPFAPDPPTPTAPTAPTAPSRP
jgi:hypothetical protein